MEKKVVAKLVEYSPEQYDAIKRAARAANAPSLSEWIRQACAAQAKREHAQRERARREQEEAK